VGNIVHESQQVILKLVQSTGQQLEAVTELATVAWGGGFRGFHCSFRYVAQGCVVPGKGDILNRWQYWVSFLRACVPLDNVHVAGVLQYPMHRLDRLFAQHKLVHTMRPCLGASRGLRVFLLLFVLQLVAVH
jgi:hypothetical protein